MKGYDYIVDDNTDTTFAVQRSTGEVLPAGTFTVPLGTVFFTPEDQAEYAERKAQKQETKKRRDKAGHYYFASRDGNYSELSSATMARLIYLATYMGYDGTLMITERKPMKRKDLQSVMGLSTKPVYDFWNAVKQRYTFEGEGKTLHMNKDYFHRGKINRATAYQQLYNSAVRDLYRATKPTQHNRLGAVFQMLRWVNLEFNVLCYNPAERDLDRVEFMTLDDFCDKIGFDKSNRHRLIKDYSRITFPVNGVQKRFCSFVSDGTNIGTANIFVNPNIMYRGNSWERVEILGKF